MSGSLPDAHHIPKQTERHPWILAALMFEKQVQEGLSCGSARAEEQITFGAHHLRINKRGVLEPQGPPVHL